MFFIYVISVTSFYCLYLKLVNSVVINSVLESVLLSHTLYAPNVPCVHFMVLRASDMNNYYVITK